MSDYIEKNEVILLIKKSISWVAPKGETMDYNHGVVAGLGMACDIVEALSSADVAPVRHGRAIYKDDGNWYCETCGRQIPDLHEYCNHCGVKIGY